MKPKSPSLLNGPHISFPYLPLYLADLRYMTALATEKGFHCSISDDEHEYEDVDDLVSHCGSRISKLSIKFFKGEVTFNNVTLVASYSGVALSSDSGDEFVALDHRLRTYLRKRAPWFAFGMNTWLWIPALGVLIPFIITRSNKTYYPVAWSILEPLFFIDVALVWISLLVPLFFGGVHLKKKDDVVGPFAKYEKLIIAALSAVVGVAGKWLVDHSGSVFH